MWLENRTIHAPLSYICHTPITYKLIAILCMCTLLRRMSVRVRGVRADWSFIFGSGCYSKYRTNNQLTQIRSYEQREDLVVTLVNDAQEGIEGTDGWSRK